MARRVDTDCLPYTKKQSLVQEVFSVEGKNDIVAPIFKTKNSIVNKEEFIPRPATKLQVDNIELW